MKFLRKLFIKNYDDVTNPEVREKHGILASVCGVIINLILFVFKIIIGIFTFSMSIISDAINNLTDLFSCFVNLFGFKLAARPPDKKHPFGHQRIEYIAGMVVAFLIISVAVTLGYTSISNLVNRIGAPKYNIYAFIILSVSILAKLLLGFIYRGLGKDIKSESLKASMVDSLNDCLCTTGVLIAAIINFYVDAWWLDSTIALAISIFILYSGIVQIVETASPLIGTSVDPRIVKQISEIILKHDVVLGFHDFVCHSYGHTKYYATVHCEVDGYQSMIETHEQIDEIEQEVFDKLAITLTIHMDPVDTKNKDLPVLKEKITEIVKSIDASLSIHDLRIINCLNEKHVFFDLVKGTECKLDEKELKQIVESKVKEINSEYIVFIKVENSFQNFEK